MDDKYGPEIDTVSRYNTRSNKVRVVKTPGGELRYLHIKKAGTAPKCGDCGIKLPGVSGSICEDEIEGWNGIYVERASHCLELEGSSTRHSTFPVAYGMRLRRTTVGQSHLQLELCGRLITLLSC